MPYVIRRYNSHGRVSVNGMVRGEIHGTVNGIIRATVDGDVDLNIISGSAAEEDKNDAE